MKETALNRRAAEELGFLFRTGWVSQEDWQHLLYLLSKDEPLPPEYHEHRLTDNWTGHWECHLSGDLIVIYKRKPTRIIFTAIGTHQELFHSRRRKAKGRKPPPTDLDEIIERALNKAAREIKRWWAARR